MYLHVFAFRCPQCSGPTVACSLEAEPRVEPEDNKSFTLVCRSCGQPAQERAVRASFHWTEPWS